MSNKAGQEFECARPGCTEKTWRSPSQIAKSKTKLFHHNMQCASMNSARWVRENDNRPICEWCGNPFPRSPSPTATNRFCPKKLRDCRSQASAAGWKTRRTRSDNGKLGKGSVMVECARPGCTNLRKATKSALQRSELLFCPGECRNLMASEIATGTTGFLDGASRTGRNAGTYLQIQTPHGIKVGVVNATGYIRVRYPEHPSASRSGYILQHRMVMEEIIGCQLGVKDTVHHLNGIRDDNRPENLVVLLNTKHPTGAAIGDLTAYWRQMIEKYEGMEETLRAAGVQTSMKEGESGG